MHTRLIRGVREELKKELPGESALLQLAPLSRSVRMKAMKQDPNPRLSGVCILLYQKRGITHFVLTKRHEYKGVHSGQISLPGGKKEEVDENLIRTALRETEEEIGVSQHEIEVLGELSSTYIPPSRFLVQPIVGVVEQPEFVLQESEVHTLMEVPLPDLLDDNNIKIGDFKIGQGKEMNIPYFDLEGERVWGATAMILSEFRQIVLRKAII